jgi:hypothetical protein
MGILTESRIFATPGRNRNFAGDYDNANRFADNDPLHLPPSNLHPPHPHLDEKLL